MEPRRGIPRDWDSSGSRFGEYAVHEVLGEGGMGVVYRATSLENGAEVALKTIRELSPKLLAAMRAEVSALKRAEHPGIVRIVDEAVAASRPWYAMELLRGISLADYQRTLFPSAERWDLPTDMEAEIAHPEREPTGERRPCAGGQLDRILAIYIRLVEALAHLHGLGIIHRDIKPSNVLLTRDGEPKILDFGLAGRFEGEGAVGFSGAVEPGRLMGTLPYMSPELIAGEVLDTRSDLYSLGCMLYEALTGQPPFWSAQPSAILTRHLHELPRPPSDLVLGVPEQLESLVLGLLEKNKRNRAGYAEDVLEQLQALAAAPLQRSGASHPRHVLRPTLTGRGELFDELCGLVQEASKSRGSVVLLRGEGGIGKTFLATEVSRQAHASGFLVISSSSTPHGPSGLESNEVHSSPLSGARGLLQALADRCRANGLSQSAPLTPEDVRLLARYEPSFALVPGFEHLPDAPVLQGALGRDRLLLGLERGLDSLCSTRPLLLILEDLQWADELTEALLAALPRLAKSRRLFALGTVREHEGAQARRRFPEVPGILRRGLGRLDDASVTAIAGDMLGTRELPQPLARFIGERAAGNPLFVAEYLRSAITTGLLIRKAGEWRPAAAIHEAPALALTLPSSIERSLIGRLSGLSDMGLRMLRTLAVVGREIDADLIEQLFRDLPTLWEVVAELKQRGVFELRPGQTIRFLHERLREIIYLETPESLRRELHGTVARTLELRSTWSEQQPRLLLEIALHWSAAGEHVAAARCYRAAGEFARATSAGADAARAFDTAAQHVRESIRGGQPGLDQELAELLEAAGDAWLLMGQAAQADQRWVAALNESPSPQVRACLLRKRATAHAALHETDLALSLLTEAEDQLQAVSNDPAQTAQWIEIRTERAWALYWPGRVDELRGLIETTEGVVRRYGTRVQQARFLQCAVLAELRMHRYRPPTTTIEKSRTALSSSEEAGSLKEILSAGFGLGFVLLLGGDFREALLALDGARVLAERCADRSTALRARAYISLAHRCLDEIERTRVTSLEVLELTEHPHLVHYRALAEANLGWVALRVEDWNTARARLVRALSLWQAARPAYPLMGLGAWPLLRVGVHDRSSSLVRQAIEALCRPDQRGLPRHVQDTLAIIAEQPERAFLDEVQQLVDDTDFLTFASRDSS